MGRDEQVPADARLQPLTGRVWIFGDGVSTEYMMPGYTMLAKMSDEEARFHCMEAIRPGFARLVTPGDILVCGENFGCGSSRLASRLLIALGISAVVAESFAGIFYRNAINAGLPVVELGDARRLFDEGDRCRIDLLEGIVENLERGTRAHFEPLGEHLIGLLNAGGLIPFLRRELEGSALLMEQGTAGDSDGR
jgi:3-isopropylmalate/(R)-2-methylmalate dehydratase small subunit